MAVARVTQPTTVEAPRGADHAAGVVTLPVAVRGLGAYLPKQVLTNDDWAAVLDTSDEWIRSRTGIVERHVAAPHEATSDLALAAAEAALADAGLDAADLGAIVVATTTPDHQIPGSAPAVAAGLGVTAPALDCNAACSGFVYGLRLAGGLVATGSGPVLLVGAELFSRATDHRDRDTAVLFGDGAGAVVLDHDPAATLGPFDLGADGTQTEILWSPASGSRTPPTPEAVAAGAHLLAMQGREVYRHAVTRMAASSRAVLDAAGVAPADVDLFVGHQANARILDAVASRVGITAEQAHLTVDRHGNTSAASIPLALTDARDAGRLHPGDRVLLTAFGAGLTWGSCLLTWSTA